MAHTPPPEYEVVSAWRVSCDGGEGALGHPRVWLSLDRDTGYVECPYCDKLFVHEDFAAEVLPKFGIAA
ncbi:MAG: zinc-finger domain-containing protein [Shimia sp.]